MPTTRAETASIITRGSGRQVVERAAPGRDPRLRRHLDIAPPWLAVGADPFAAQFTADFEQEMAHAHIEQPVGREIDRIALGEPRQVERRVFAAPDAPLRGIEVDRPRGRHAGRGRRTIDGPGAAKAPRFGQTAKTRVESALAGARDFERGCDDMGEFARPLTPYRPAARRFGNECGRTDQSRGSP